MSAAKDKVLQEISAERDAQDAEWGEQNHHDLSQGNPDFDRDWYRQKAEVWKTENARRLAAGVYGWDGVLQEEVYEALAEKDPAKLRAELVQVAAVAAAWIEAIDRRDA